MLYNNTIIFWSGSALEKEYIQEELARREFIEDMGLLFEETGRTRMAGKILGSLLICSPPYQSALELAASTGGNKAAISIATREMMESGFVERFGLPGKKSVYYRVKERHLLGIIKQRLAAVEKFQPLALRGMNLVAGIDSKQYSRLKDLSELYDFLQGEMPRIIEEWKKRANFGIPAE
jgi:hypothetical protein